MTTVRAALTAVAILVLAPFLAAAPPMRVALIVDTSASTAAAIPQIRAAASAFIDALPPDDEVVLVSTGRRVQVRVPPTTDRAKLKASVAALLTENGPTALIDALLETDRRFMAKAADRLGVYVMITGDGSENSKEADEQTFNRWLQDIVKRGVSANAVVLKGSSNGLPDAIASTLVRATHGHYTSMGNGATLPDAMTRLAGQLADEASHR
jgi:Mg-chelatase subunit ChlD